MKSMSCGTRLCVFFGSVLIKKGEPTASNYLVNNGNNKFSPVFVCERVLGPNVS